MVLFWNGVTLAVFEISEAVVLWPWEEVAVFVDEETVPLLEETTLAVLEILEAVLLWSWEVVAEFEAEEMVLF
jgi:hypothetical protein